MPSLPPPPPEDPPPETAVVSAQMASSVWVTAETPNPARTARPLASVPWSSGSSAACTARHAAYAKRPRATSPSTVRSRGPSDRLASAFFEPPVEPPPEKAAISASPPINR